MDFYKTGAFNPIRKFLQAFYLDGIFGSDLIRAAVAENDTHYIFDIVYRIYALQQNHQYYKFSIDRFGLYLELVRTFRVPAYGRKNIVIDETNRNNILSLVQPEVKTVIVDFLPRNELYDPNAKIFEVVTLEFLNRFNRTALISVIKYMYPE